MKRYLSLFLFLILAVSVVFSVNVNASAADYNTLTFKNTAAESSLAENAAEGKLTFLTETVYDGCYGNQLTGVAKELYDSLTDYYASDKNTGEYTHTFAHPFTFNAEIVNNSIVMNDELEEISLTIDYAIQVAMDAFLYDYPEVFWLRLISSGYSVSASGNSADGYIGKVSEMTITPTEIYEGASKKITQYDEAVSSALSSITVTESRYDTLKNVHDYICNNAYYNLIDDYRVHSSEAFFIGDGGVVCEGYAKSFKVLCDKLNIPCVLVSGDAGGAHMWNYVQMEDGKWYLVDVTWDDQEGKICDTYFLANANTVGFNDVSISEERTERTDFSGMGYFSFTYPELSTTAHTVHTHEWESEYTVDKEPTCTEKGSKSRHCSLCTQVKDVTEIETTEHTFTVYTSDSNATCISDGTKTAVCDGCKRAKNTVQDEGSLNKNSHKIIKDKAVAASCTKGGLTEGSHCGLCKKVTVSQKTVYPLGHTSDGGKITQTASYKQWGIKEYRCTDCKDLLYTEYSERLTLTAPEKVRISAVKTTSFTVSWNGVKGAEQYRVYYSLDGKKWKEEEVKSRTSIKLKNLKKGKKYFVKVVAAASDNESKESKTVKTSTLPAKVTVKKVKSLKSRQAEISWKTLSSVTGYEISYSTSKKFTKKTTNKATVKKQKTNKKTVKKLKKGKKYYFRVRAYTVLDGKKIYGEWSKIKSVRVK